MAECPKLGVCPFFNDQLANMPAVAESLKERFCRGDFESCARYRVSSVLGKERVPGNLFPQEADTADRLLSNHKQ